MTGIAKLCHYCKRGLQHPTSRSRTAATRDHYVPKHAGGRRKVPCCRQCNNLKGPLMPEAWQRVMQVYPEWWKRFRDRGELIEAQRIDAWRAHRRRAEAGKWPRDVRVPFPALCRGLPRSLAA